MAPPAPAELRGSETDSRWQRLIKIAENGFWNERLLQSQKLAALGELSAGIAHEINNPLAIIRQEAEWMQHLLKKEYPGR